MRKKQLLAFLMAGALSVGMTPAAAFAAEDTAVEASGEEVAGELDGTDAAEAPAEETTEEETPAESETPAEETADNTDTAETPAEEETPAENTAEEEAPAQAEETQTPAEETTETAAIMINETAYGSLAEAFAALPDTSDPINDPTYIKIRGEIEVAASVDVPAGKSAMLVAAEEGTTIKRAAGFTGSIFTVSGGTLMMTAGTITDADGNVTGSGSLNVDGTGDATEGSIVDVQSGIFGMADGVTLTGNQTSGNGGAISNAAGASVYLTGGTISGNAAAAGGGIYSEGTVNLQGTVTVTGNGVKDASEVSSNVVLAGDGVLNVAGAMTGSVIGVSVQDAVAGKTVVALADGVQDVTLADVLTQVTYEGDSSLKLGEDGVLADAAEPTATPKPTGTPKPTSTPKPTETPEEPVTVTGKSVEWSGHSSVKITFRSNVKGTYYIDWVKRGEKAPTIDSSMTGAPIDANIDVTANVTDLPEDEVDIYVCVISDKDKSNYGSLLFQPISAERPSAPVTETPTPTPSHTAVIANVSDSKVQGFENALTFYPNTFYEFKVVGAGTENNNPGEGDVRWVPLYWSMSSNPGASDQHTVWKIGAQSGIYTDTEKTYNIYVFFQKEVYNGSTWQQESGSIQSVQYQFKAAPLAKTTVTPTGSADGTGGDGTSGDGTTGDGTTDVTPTSYADSADGTSKSAVSTGDESPIGTMLALAAASLLAGGYVLIRRRKKEM